MTMITWLEEIPNRVVCVICNQYVHVTEATVGELYRDGRQAFACAAHLHCSERMSWFAAWAKFAAQQTETAPTTEVNR